MTATLILPGSAPEADWLAARRRGVTASEIPVIMGLAPEGNSWSSPYKLYWQKTGDLPADDDTDRLELGRHLEPYVAARFTRRHPEFYITSDGRALYAHPERPWQMATPDRLVHEDGTGYLRFPPAVAVLECKTWGTFDGWGDDGSDEIPVHIRAQALWQADVMGVASAFVACVFLPSAQLRVYELTVDDLAQDDLALMRLEAGNFLGRVTRGDPPDVDWRPATTATLKHLHPMLDPDVTVIVPARLARWYRAAQRDLKDAERRKALHENRIRGILGTGRYANGPDGLPIARRDVYDLPEKAITRKACTVDRLVPLTRKEPS